MQYIGEFSLAWPSLLYKYGNRTRDFLGGVFLSILGPDYMSRAGPASRAALVCRADFQPGIT